MVEDKEGQPDRHHDGDQLAVRVDKMLTAGRITAEEVNRVRLAADADALAAVLGNIPRRHIAEWGRARSRRVG